MTLLEQTRDWLQSLAATAGFAYSLGAWTEQPGRRICLWQDGGSRMAEEDYPVVRLLLVGERKTESDALPLLQVAEAIRTAAANTTCVGSAARVTPIGGIVGPGYTTEGRAQVEINLQFLI